MCTPMSGFRLGLIVNPIAGMGGTVGLKGTDGRLAAAARSLGATPLAGGRALTALSQLAIGVDKLSVLTCSGAMGADAVRQCGLDASILYRVADRATRADDSRAGAARIIEERPDLLLFVGGDGTARDLLEVVGSKIPLLGVPSGVKMHSAVFAATARAAGEVVRNFLVAGDRQALLRDAEVMDREIVTAGTGGYAEQLSPRLYGMVRTPSLSFLVPGAKSASRLTDQAALAGAVRRVADQLGDERISLLGPGSTMQLLKRRCGFEGTPLGVDAVANGRRLALDLNERRILDLIQDRPARIVVSVVGGQGFLFGRGNQQLSSRVIRAVGIDGIVVVSSLEKLSSLPGGCLLVDSGDERLDELLAGHIEVRTGALRTTFMPVGNTHGRALG